MSQQDNSSPRAKLIEPTLHFASKRLKTDDGSSSSLLVSELVQPGQLLADFPGFERYAAKGYEKQPLKDGPHTAFTPDGQSLIASTFGYPKIDALTAENGLTLLIISLVPLIRVSFDKLRAFLIIYPSLPNHPGLAQYDLPQLLQKAGITYGIDEVALDQARRVIAEGKPEISEIGIAEGKPPGPGTDAALSFALEIGPIAGQLRKDGSIDFRERRIMIGIEQDQLIAEKLPAVPGTPGINVLGEAIEPKTGRDITIFAQGDAAYSPATAQIRATRDGVLSVINKNTIRVSAHQVINGDIDFTTGNIDANGCLTINGSISNGFKVSSIGDLKIGGSVMSATVKTDANAVIQGGITGKASTITCGGDLDIKFIERGTITAGGRVVIRSQAYFSRIRAGGDIRCHPLSKIMAGELVAGGHLSVGNIGGQNSEPTLLGAGIESERLDLYETTRNELNSLQNTLIQWLQLHGRARSRKVRKMEKEIAETKARLLTLNLIPGTELYSRGSAGASRDDIEEISPLYHQGIDIDNIRIDINGTAHTGTHLLLGNRSLVLQQSVSRRQFKLSADLKRIISFPLRG